MKNIKALLAGVLAAATVLSFAGCDEEGTVVQSGEGGTLPSTTTAGTTTTQQTFDTDPAVQDAVGKVEDLIDSEIKVTKKVKFLSWYDMDETTAELELFKKVYGVPTEGGAEDEAEQVVEYLNVAYGARYEKLATLNSGGRFSRFVPV